MAFTRLEDDLNIISALGDNPNTDDGLSAEQLKAKFDESVNIIKTYINNTLLTQALQKQNFTGICKLVSGVLTQAVSGVDYVAGQHTHSQNDVTGLGTALSELNGEVLEISTELSGKQDTLDADQKRHIFVVNTAPLSGAADGIYLVV